MRKLTTTDVFSALRLVQKSGLKDKLVPVIEDLAKKGETVERSGIMGILTLVEVFAEEKCENLIYEWLAPICECKAKDFKTMPPDEFIQKLIELKEDNNLQNFFTYLSRLLSPKR